MLIAALCLLLPANGPVAPATIDTGDVAWTVRFQTSDGIYGVVLPDDMRAGDSISGTSFVIPDPKGDTSQIRGYVLNVGGEVQNAGSRRVKFAVPAILGAGAIALVLKDPKGHTVGTIKVPCNKEPDAGTWNGFAIPPLAQPGHTAEINGRFGGDAGGTSCTLGGQALTVLAESPRGCFVAIPQNASGAPVLQVTDGGQTAQAPLPMVTLQMSAPVTTLLSGQSTTATFTATGLGLVNPDAFPISCEVVNQTPGVIKMPDCEGNRKAFGIEQSMVQNGAFTTTFAVNALHTGAFGIKGVLFNVSFHVSKAALGAADLKAIIDALILQTEKELKDAKAEDAKAGGGGGGKKSAWALKADRLQAKLDKLKLAKDGVKDDPDNAKIILDKAMADSDLITVGAGLIGLAADMLGYTDLPLPGIGTLLKGLKAISKAPKVLDIIDKIEKLLKVIEKLSDAKEKADKVQELKDQMDKLKDAQKAAGAEADKGGA